MTREEAIEIYLLKTRQARTTIQRIMSWDENISLKENSSLFNYNVGSTQGFKVKFGLKSVCIRKRECSKKSDVTDAYLILRKQGWTFEKIARVFKRKTQTVEQGISRRDLIKSKV